MPWSVVAEACGLKQDHEVGQNDTFATKRVPEGAGQATLDWMMHVHYLAVCNARVPFRPTLSAM